MVFTARAAFDADALEVLQKCLGSFFGGYFFDSHGGWQGSKVFEGWDAVMLDAESK